MTIYRVDQGALTPFEETTFAAAGIRERQDLQRLLRQQVDVIEPDILVIAEEFGDWEGARRRIDLLAIDRRGNLVVIELKRTEDGGHLELQALRYAAMVSAMSFDEAAQAFDQYLSNTGQPGGARERMLEFLGWDEAETDQFPVDVRIVLASAEFSTEVTTTVLWLETYGLNVKCVRLKPYKDGDRLLIDVQQVIPLPEAEDYQIRIRDKKVALRTQNRDFTRFDVTVGSETLEGLPKRRAILAVIRGLCAKGVDPEALIELIPWRSDALHSVEGTLKADAFPAALTSVLAAQGRRVDVTRIFTGEDELIHANGRTYAVTKMWGPRTAEAMEQMLEAFPGRGVSVGESR